MSVNVAEASASSSERFNRRRDELWWKAREFFAAKACAIDDGLPLAHKLAAELSAPRYAYLPSGRIKVEGKDELKRRGVPSPNIADAFVLTMAHADRFAAADDTCNPGGEDGPSRFL